MALFACQLLYSAEDASLEASVLSGALEIDPASIAGPITPITGTGISTDEEQLDGVRFRIENIVVKDLNGDGFGFQLTAQAENLIRVGYNGSGGNRRRRRNTMEVGTIGGFLEPSDPINSNIVDPNTLVYESGQGVILEVDYEIGYTIPAFAREGAYQGEIIFSIIAE